MYTVTVDQCDRPRNITNGGISYEDDDPNNIFVGNRIEYNCANGTELKGSKYRFCQRNGNWSDSEPECKGQEAACIISENLIGLLFHPS
jgi:hypothetical protein